MCAVKIYHYHVVSGEPSVTVHNMSTRGRTNTTFVLFLVENKLYTTAQDFRTDGRGYNRKNSLPSVSSFVYMRVGKNE